MIWINKNRLKKKNPNDCVYIFFICLFFCYIRLRKVPRLHKQQSNNRRINNVNKAKDSYSPLRFSIFIPSSYYL